MNFFEKLLETIKNQKHYRLSMTSLSSLVWCLLLRLEPTRVKHLSSAILLGRLGWKRLAMDKYGSLLQKIVNYMYQKFYNIVPLTLFYKNFTVVIYGFL